VDGESVLESQIFLTSSNYKVGVENSARDRILENVLPIRVAEVVEREVLLGNVTRIKKALS